jgi:pSer/pThr/pTyr-binding forkhead associated (FHA) protein
MDAETCVACGAPLGFNRARPRRPAIAREVIPPELAGRSAASSEGSSMGAGSVPRAEPEPPQPTPILAGPVRLPVGFTVTEALMEQARSFVCKNCYTPVPQGHKFCGRCGASVPREVMAAQTLLLSRMLEPGKAKLVVIKGEGVSSDPNDETAYLLGARQHVTGRSQGPIVFERDVWLSPKHANFYYRDDGRLVVRDEGSLNGVYVRLRKPVEIQPGDTFLAGDQLFRLDVSPRETDQAAPDGTLFYSSPKQPAAFRVTQLLRGGATGMAVSGSQSIAVGREGCEMNFPNDSYMSGRHCKVEPSGAGYTLSDHGSKNGTYLRVRGERELSHGDYVFLGRELLRVDISA